MARAAIVTLAQLAGRRRVLATLPSMPSSAEINSPMRAKMDDQNLGLADRIDRRHAFSARDIQYSVRVVAPHHQELCDSSKRRACLAHV